MLIPKCRADHPRVTHPFATRVPRRALPFDLHVLSTPPAFVLSQDQTLQTKTPKDKTPGRIHNQRNPITNKRHQKLASKKQPPPHRKTGSPPRGWPKNNKQKPPNTL